MEDLFSALGSPRDLIDLRCAIASAEVSLFNHRGTRLARFTIHHEADLRQVRRDRLLFSFPQKGPGRIYGRDGVTVFAELHGMPWQALEKKAQEELELLGLLLRSPWIFDDPRHFVVLGRDDRFSWHGKEKVRYRIERRRPGDQVGPSTSEDQVDRFDLICPRDRHEPEALHIRFAGQQAVKIIELSDYRSFGSVRIPTRRTFLGPRGGRMMEMVLRRVDVRQDLPATQFRPQRVR